MVASQYSDGYTHSKSIVERWEFVLTDDDMHSPSLAEMMTASERIRQTYRGTAEMQVVEGTHGEALVVTVEYPIENANDPFHRPAD